MTVVKDRSVVRDAREKYEIVLVSRTGAGILGAKMKPHSKTIAG